MGLEEGVEVTGAVIARLKRVSDSPGLLAVNWLLALLQVTGLEPPFIYRSILLRETLTWLPAASVAVKVLSGKCAVKVPVPAPVHVPDILDGVPFVTVVVETILLMVKPLGAVLVELMPVIVKAVLVVTLLGAVAVTVKTLPTHSALVV